ncbi:hypothetical protein CVS40_7250 [Lucilia cuprina]|nr:hypothetical protein CVS40_7250 [Lucilia cuprina]
MLFGYMLYLAIEGKMKLIQLDHCKAIAMISVLFGLLIYYEYHIFFKTIPNDYLYKLSNQTENFENITISNNENNATASKRIKRFLIFQGGGVVKLVFGTSYPIIMADKTRSLGYFYNFQMQYPPPTIPVYWWSFYNTTTFAARRNARKRSTKMLLSYDKSRSLIYDFIETILQRPLRSNVDDRYINARIAGENGANCDETFGKCPIVEQLFKRYTQYI